jgi:uncharacterized protein YqhQ
MSQKPSYGGQAVIEGVMMRGPRHFAVACRRLDGEIVVKQEDVPAFFTRYAWARWPFLRGVFALADGLVLGMKSLLYSANLALEDPARAEAEKPKPQDVLTSVLVAPVYWMLGVGAPAPAAPGGSISNIAVTGSAFVSMAIGIGLFMLFPSLVAGAAPEWVPTAWRPIIEGLVRVVLVLGYIWAIGRMKNIQRLFQYHGAEHQAINALETEGVVDVDAAVRASRIHPRCGTNFILTVLLIKMAIFALLPWQPIWYLRLGLRLAMLPVVAALSYEVIRLAGRFRGFAPLQWLVLPGLMTQYLTTRVPDREMVEVAVASLSAVMEREGVLVPQAAVAPTLA